MLDTSSRAVLGSVVLGRYRIVAPLARGGMGIIYLGRLEGAAGFSKPVVIKTVIPEGNDSKGIVQLFVREARILSNLEHPSIVGVLDFGEAGADYVMVLEYVHGFHLGAWSRFVRHTRGSMKVAHAVEVLLPILDALDFAHALKRPDGTPLGIVHRDISPANILIDNQGHVKLHDFGIARMADDEFKTQDGTFRGTLSYTAPETLQGIPASPRSDLYGCAAVLYQLLSGKNPFKGDSPSETLHRVLKHVPPPLHTVREEVDANLSAIVARALDKNPDARFASAADFAEALRGARTWPETRAIHDLAITIQSDFNSQEMAEYLEVEPLAARDKAWRAVAGVKASLSSIPPPPDADDPALRPSVTIRHKVAPRDPQATIHALPSRALLAMAREGQAEADERASEVARAVVGPEPATQASSAPAKTKLPLILAGVGLIALLGGLAVFFGFRASREEAAPRFLLIEKQVGVPTASQAPPTPSASGPLEGTPPTAAAEVTGGVPSPNVKASAVSPGPGGLSGAFQHQQGRVASCFRANPDDVGSAPQLSIRFKIDGSGQVQSAELSPPGISQSALGGCILGVARSTRFPGNGSAVTFVVPITAVRK